MTLQSRSLFRIPATHKESAAVAAATVSIIAATVCLRLLSHPDEAPQHHKCFVASNASQSRGERRVSARRFVWSQRGSNDSCLLQSARRLSEAGFLSKSEGPSRLHPSTRLCSSRCIAPLLIMSCESGAAMQPAH